MLNHLHRYPIEINLFFCPKQSSKYHQKHFLPQGIGNNTSLKQFNLDQQWPCIYNWMTYLKMYKTDRKNGCDDFTKPALPVTNNSYSRRSRCLRTHMTHLWKLTGKHTEVMKAEDEPPWKGPLNICKWQVNKRATPPRRMTSTEFPSVELWSEVHRPQVQLIVKA